MEINVAHSALDEDGDYLRAKPIAPNGYQELRRMSRMYRVGSHTSCDRHQSTMARGVETGRSGRGDGSHDVSAG